MNENNGRYYLDAQGKYYVYFDGYYYRVDEEGQYVIDANGNYEIGDINAYYTPADNGAGDAVQDSSSGTNGNSGSNGLADLFNSYFGGGNNSSAAGRATAVGEVDPYYSGGAAGRATAVGEVDPSYAGAAGRATAVGEVDPSYADAAGRATAVGDAVDLSGSGVRATRPNTASVAPRNTTNNVEDTQRARVQRLENWVYGQGFEGNKGVYLLKEVLAVGGEAVLFICTRGEEETKYVFKLYDMVSNIDPVKRKAFTDFLYNTTSDYIVKLEDYGDWQGTFYDVYPYLENGDLSQGTYSLDFIKNVLIPDMNEALHDIHSSSISHRDIKPQNILISNDGKHVLVHDFSIMSVMDEMGGRATRHGDRTDGFAAPEVFTFRPHIKSDYYALGITILCLLNGGKDIYEGMSQEDIRSCTIYNKIPTLNPQIFVNAIKEKLTEEEKLKGLACGLTIQDVNERWGYEEVKDWVKGKKLFPFIQPKSDKIEFTNGVVWDHQRYYNKLALANALVADWEEAKRATARGGVPSAVGTEDPKLGSHMSDIFEKGKRYNLREETGNVGFFRAIYTLAPDMTAFSWKGKQYPDLATFAGELYTSNSIDKGFKALLKDKALSWYLKTVEIFDTLPEAVKKRINQIENEAQKNADRAYYMFIFAFLPQNMIRSIRIGKDEVKLMDDFTIILAKSENPGALIKQYILPSDMVYAFMWLFGSEAGYKQVISDYDPNNVTEAECFSRFCRMLDGAVNNKVKLRQVVMSKSEFSHVFWLQGNLDKYQFETQNAQKVRDYIAGVELTTSMKSGELFDTMKNMSQYYASFVSLCCKNPYEINDGVSTENSEIFPLCASASLVYMDDGQYYPYSYIKGNKAVKASEVYSTFMDKAATASNDIAKQIIGTAQGAIDSINKVLNSYYRFNIPRIILCLIYGGIPFISLYLSSLYEIEPRIVLLVPSIIACLFPLVLIIFESINLKEGIDVSGKLNELKGYISHAENWHEATKSYEGQIKAFFDGKGQDVGLNVPARRTMIDFSDVVEASANEKVIFPQKRMSILRKVAFSISGIALSFITSLLIIRIFGYDVLSKFDFVNYIGAVQIGIIGIYVLTLAADIAVIYFFKNKNYGTYLLFPLASIAAIIVAALLALVIVLIVIIIKYVLAIVGAIIAFVVVCTLMGGS